MCTLFLVYPIGIVRLMKFQVPFSAIATVSLLISVIMIFREILKDLPSLNSQPTVKEITRWPLFISTVFVSMEGVGPVNYHFYLTDYFRINKAIQYTAIKMKDLTSTIINRLADSFK